MKNAIILKVKTRTMKREREMAQDIAKKGYLHLLEIRLILLW